MGGTICRTEEVQAEEKNKRMGFMKKPTEPLQVIESGKGIANICSQQLGNPQQNYFQFEEFSFDSKFESGNLNLVQRVGLYNYNIWVNPEKGSGYQHGTNAWFYFEVRPLAIGPNEIQEAKFTIKNLPSDLDEAFERRAAPVYLNLIQSPEWQYIHDSNLETVVYENLVELKIKYIFTGKDEKVCFAFSFPYTLKDAKAFLDSIEAMHSENPKVHFVRQTITESIEKRPIECITFTGCKGSEGSHVKPIQGLKSFTQQGSDNEGCETEEGCYKSKKCVLITCRTNPGETAASFALEGLIKRILCQDDDVSKAALSSFVFLIIPIVNPDGVVRGNMRTDSRGKDLSRIFERATRDNYPAPVKITEIAKKLKDDGILTMTLDLRANYLIDSVTLHSSIHKNLERDIPISVFSTLFDICCKNEVVIKRTNLKELQLKESEISDFNNGFETVDSEQKLKINRTPLDFNYGLKAFAMSNTNLPLKDKRVQGPKIRKEGCRVFMDQVLEVNLAFCIDINFFCGIKKENQYISISGPNTREDLKEDFKIFNDRNLRAQTQPNVIESIKRIEETDALIHRNSTFKKKKKEYLKMYTNDYRQIGEAFLLSLLEFTEINPKSVLSKTFFKTPTGVHEYCKKLLIQQENQLKNGGINNLT